MKPLRIELSLLLVAAAFASGCSATKDNSIIVTAARAPGDECDFGDPTLYVEGGAVDLAVAPGYYQVFSWENTLQEISTTVNGDTISGPQLNTFVATQVELSYVLVGGPAIPSGIINMNATITAGATPDKNSVGVQLLTQQALAAAYAFAIPPDPTLNEITGPSSTLLVTFQLVGGLVGGSGAATNPVTYPLTIFKGNTPVAGVCPTLPGVPAAVPPIPPATLQPTTTSCGIPGRDITYCEL